MASCGYCTHSTGEDGFLPLVCRLCERSFHLNCLNCERRPTALRGDQLFELCCSSCSGTGKDTWRRLNLNWVHVIHLALYNLIVTDGGRDGFFRWNTGICNYIERHWFDMLPCKNKTSSWQCTVAGTLSVHCPSLFCSGTKLFGENGWWSLQETKPPKLIDVMKTLGDQMRKGGSYRSSVTNESRKRTLEEKEKESVHKKIKDDPELMIPLSLHQERLLLNFMSSKGTVKDPSYSRILRKLKVSRLKRELGQPLFNLSQYTKESLDNTKHYTTSEYHELPYPLVNLSYHKKSSDNLQFSTSKAISIMSRVNNPILPVLVNHHVRDKDTFISQYTSHLLPYVIFKSSSFLPPKIQILKELVTKVSPDDDYSIKPIIFSYFRKHHLSSVNAFISYFFWPVDLSEYLQYPDFTVIVTYGNKIIIGCGFMTPDASISESYIPFLLVHPDYQCTGIGKIILYHLIQSCQGKDVLLHVAVDNKAMLMYQMFGFKTEQFCIDFYDKYHPHNYHLSKHAFLMRLRR